MNPTILTIILFVVPLVFLALDFRRYQINKKKGEATSIKPLQTIVMVIVMLLALFALVTGRTYNDVMAMFN